MDAEPQTSFASLSTTGVEALLHSPNQQVNTPRNTSTWEDIPSAVRFNGQNVAPLDQEQQAFQSNRSGRSVSSGQRISWGDTSAFFPVATPITIPSLEDERSSQKSLSGSMILQRSADLRFRTLKGSSGGTEWTIALELSQAMIAVLYLPVQASTGFRKAISDTHIYTVHGHLECIGREKVIHLGHGDCVGIPEGDSFEIKNEALIEGRLIFFTPSSSPVRRNFALS